MNEQAKIQHKVDDINNITQKSDLLIVKSVNDWMIHARTLPDPVQLWDNVWFSGESCFLYGGPGSGKSVLSVQIGVEIAQKEPVLYCDFELNVRQFRKRYRTTEGIEYLFPEHFYRAEFAKDIEFDSTALIESIEFNANKLNTKVLIIDNISWIIENSEKGDVAGNFMKKLTKLKNNNGFSILTVAHTPKRDDSNPITIYDMAGSMRLQNFIDSSFAIVISAREQGKRYLKQTKSRSEEKTYDFENVLELSLDQDEYGFLRFLKGNTECETYHLKKPTDSERSSKKEKCLELLENNFSYREIREQTGLSLGVISKYKKEKEEIFKDLPF